MTIIKDDPGPPMGSVGDILAETLQAEQTLQEGDKHITIAVDRSHALAELAGRVGDLLHQASMLLTDDVDTVVIHHAAAGGESYGNAAGLLMSVMFGSNNENVGRAATHTSNAIAAASEERVIVLAAALRNAANRICEAEVAITELGGLARRTADGLRISQAESAAAQDELQAYVRDKG